MHTLKHPLVWISILLFCINQIIEKYFHVFLPVVHAYLDDLLCMPVVLGVSMQVIQWIHPLRQFYTLSQRHIFLAVVYYSILFEVVLPFFSPIYTSDGIDIILYALGGLIFYWFVAKPKWEVLKKLMND